MRVSNRDSCTVGEFTVVESRPEHRIVHLLWRIISRFSMVTRRKRGCRLQNNIFCIYVSILILAWATEISRIFFYSARIAIRTEHCPFQFFKVADNIAFPHGGAGKVWVRVQYLFFGLSYHILFFLGQPGCPSEDWILIYHFFYLFILGYSF